MTANIFDEIKKGIVLLDGGMGTELIARGFPQGACPESWNVENINDSNVVIHLGMLRNVGEKNRTRTSV